MDDSGKGTVTARSLAVGQGELGGDMSVQGTYMLIKDWMALSGQEEYMKFCEMSMSLRAWAVFAIFIVFMQFPFYTYSYILDLRMREAAGYKTNAIVAICAMSWMAALVLLTGTSFLYFYNQKHQVDSLLNRLLKPYIVGIRAIMVLGMTGFYGFRLLSRVVRGECDASQVEYGSSLNCNPQANVNGIPPESLFILMGGQILFMVLFRDVRTGVMMLSWLESCIFLFASLYINRARAFFPTVATFIFISLFVLLESARHHVSLYYVTVQLKAALKENETMTSQMHATEMRHMIANVAHDLKTPLTSFVSGIELIADVAVDLQKRNGEARVTTQYLQDSIISVLNCITNIRNTNSFMLMTINRCIDYTKASKGLKLVPKYETIDLMDTLSLPLNCMKDIQQRVSISMEPVAKDICSHIITDKQWLQENILCLLSNAVKYSSGGKVTILMYIVPGSKRNSKISKKPTPIYQQSKKYLSLSTRGSQVYPTAAPSLDAGDDELGIVIQQIIPDEPDEVAAHVWPQAQDHFEEPCNEYLRIEIEDNGIGLSEEAMSNLFNPFKQAQRLAGGTGLGLYSLARRVEALNGYYGVDHRRDGEQGCMFWFSVPYRADKVSAGSIRRSMFPRRGSLITSFMPGMAGKDEDRVTPGTTGCNSLNQSPKTDLNEPIFLPADNENEFAPMDESCKTTRLDILIVDDSPAIIKMTSMMLRRLGHTITIAENGDVALKKIWERLEETKLPFDVVLMDLQMPVMDGLEATRRLRTFEFACVADGTMSTGGSPNALRGRMPKAMHSMSSSDSVHSSSPSTPNQRNSGVLGVSRHQFVIGVSANSDHGTTQEAMQAGVDMFMSKPFTIETFYDTYEKMKAARPQSSMGLLHSPHLQIDPPLVVT